MTLETVRDKISQKLSRASALNAKVAFDFGDDGIVSVDATQDPPVIGQDGGDAAVTLVSSLETFEKILDGAQDPNVAFLMGKLKVQGSMGLAMKLNALLEE